jgi:hypothetical protein
MERREALERGALLLGTVAVAGCADVEEVSDDTTEKAAEEAERTVNETLEEELVRPPNAEIEIQDDGTIILLSLDPDTVGIKCGLIEGDDPVAEIKESDKALTTPGTELENCQEELIIAVNEAGDVGIIAEL